MRFSTTLTVAAAGLSFALYPHFALGQAIGDGKHVRVEKRRSGIIANAVFPVSLYTLVQKLPPQQLHRRSLFEISILGSSSLCQRLLCAGRPISCGCAYLCFQRGCPSPLSLWKWSQHASSQNQPQAKSHVRGLQEMAPFMAFRIDGKHHHQFEDLPVACLSRPERGGQPNHFQHGLWCPTLQRANVSADRRKKYLVKCVL